MGDRFGRLVVEEMLYGYNGGKKTYVRCRCDCGNETIALRTNVTRGLTQSCGCYERESRFNRESHSKDLTGMRFGHLTAIRKSGKRFSNGSIGWTCSCDCGNMIDVSSGHLLRGKTRSCGCNRRSKYEEIVQEILVAHEIDYEQEKVFEGCRNVFPLKFDFYLPFYNTCIECQGQQHYDSVPFFGGKERFFTVQNNDRIKRTFCKDNQIALLCLPYTLTRAQVEQEICNVLFPCND